MNEKVPMLVEDNETTWNYSKYHIGDWIEMYTTDKIIMRWYEDFALKYPEYCKVINDDKYGMSFSIDPRCMGFKPRAPRKGPNLSDEQKQANIERLAKYRKKKNEG